MSSLVKDLKKVGLNNIEAKTYLATLELGKGSAIQISREAKIPRTSVYDAIDTLRKQGLISEGYNDLGKKVFVAESPKNILDFILKRRDSFSEILPVLLSTFDRKKATSNIEVLVEKKAFVKWQEIVLSQPKGSTLYSIGDSMFYTGKTETTDKDVKQYFKNKASHRICTKAISSNYIIGNEAIRRNYTKDRNQKELRQKRYFPTIAKFGFMIECIGNFIYVRCSSLDNLRIIVSNEELGGVFANIFELIWKNAHEIPETKE